MIEESTRLQDIRLERLQDLQNRHIKELDDFDTVSRRHVQGSPRSSSRHSYTSGISESSGRFNQGSPRHSNRSLGNPSSRYPLQQQQPPSRENSVSMVSLQSSRYSDSTTSSMQDRSNGSAGDRRSFHGGQSSSQRRWKGSSFQAPNCLVMPFRSKDFADLYIILNMIINEVVREGLSVTLTARQPTITERAGGRTLSRWMERRHCETNERNVVINQKLNIRRWNKKKRIK